MPNQSYAQSCFWGGEWSPKAQARFDDREYAQGLALCLNQIPNPEGSLTPRSGFKRCGNTKTNAPAKLWPFRFDLYQPYVAEHTFENLRLWANGFPILAVEAASFVSVTGSSPPTFTIQDTRFAGTGLVPAEWQDGDSIVINFESIAGIEGAGYLAQREFTLNIVSASAGTITLTDAVTGNPLSGAVTGIDFAVFYRILDLATPYDYPGGVRQVQFTAQTVSLDADTNTISVSAPDHRATYLYPLASPRSLSYNQQFATPTATYSGRTNFSLLQEKFIDGPYLDSPGTNIPLTVSGTTGTITIVLWGWDTNIIYKKGDIAHNSGDANYPDYLSLTNDQKGNALPTTSPFINANWQQLRSYSAAVTYDLGDVVGAAPFTNGVPTIYYSIIASNTNHTPATSPSDWSTTPPTWGSGTTYAAGAVVVDSGITYTAVSVPVVGTHPSAAPTVWYPGVDYATAYTTLNDSTTGRYSGRGPQFFLNDPGDPDLSTPNLPRLFRLKVAPQPWSAALTYAQNDLVNYNDNIYKSLTNSNTANIPDQDATDWEIQTQTIQWTWAHFVTATNPDQFTATIQIDGADLANANPVWEFRFGLYSDTTGWPTCGLFHQGRLWLSSAAMPNRFDAGVSDQGFNFTPTAPDGTVADNNAIAYVLNCAENETIQSFGITLNGPIVFTSEAEWQIEASALNDPITPTSIQVYRASGWSSAPQETTKLPAATAVAQRGGRRVLEYRTFIDMLSYQSRLNSVDLTRRCQHLTVGGTSFTQYQSLPVPVLWCNAGQAIATVEYPVICTFPIPTPQVTETNTTGTLFGIGYMRAPDVSYAAPFSFEHGLTLSTGFQQIIGDIAVQRGLDDTAEYLYATVTGSDELTYMEMMMPVFDSSNTANAYNGSGVVTQFGTLARAYFLDSGITPAGCQIASNGLSCTFYGMETMAGKTLSFTCNGKYVGDYTIGSDGSVVVTFNSAFAKTDIGHAMQVTLPNATTLPGPYQTSFFLDVNGNTGVQNPSASSGAFYGQFGYAYRRRGQMLRPLLQTPDGPPFAKKRRNHRMGVYLEFAQEVSIGYTFNNLNPMKLTKLPATTALGPGDFVTGIFRDNTTDNWTFDGNLCWEQTSPVPGSVIAVGGFLDEEGG